MNDSRAAPKRPSRTSPKRRARPPPKTPSRKEGYHHGDLRRALLDATLRLVEERGPQGFTLRAAAREAGVTPAATYHHFASKDALLAAIAEEGFALARERLEAAASAPAKTPYDRSQSVGVAYVLFAVEHPTRFRIMVGYGVGEVPDDATTAYAFVRKTLIEGLRTSPDDEVSEAEILGWWSVVHGLAFLTIDGHIGRRARTSRQHVETVVRAVIDALAARRAG